MGLLKHLYSIRIYKTQTVRHPILKMIVLMVMVIPVITIIALFISNRGYQEKCSPTLLTCMRRIRGSVDNRNLSKESLPEHLRPNHRLYARIWDNLELTFGGSTDSSSDFVVVATNVAITADQRNNSTCPELGFLAPCLTHEDCPRDYILPKGHGPMTGRCVPNNDSISGRSCQISGWCPVERYPGKFPILQASGNLTIFLQAIAKFDLGGDTFYTRNVRSVQQAKILSDEDLKTCLYRKEHPTLKYCPRFRVKDVVTLSGNSFENDAIIYGGVYSIIMEWDCNFGKLLENECIPEYSFQRLSTRTEDEKIDPSSVHGITNGFRGISYGNYGHRTVYMMNGIKIVFTVTGRGHRFNFWVTFVGIGSQLENLSILYTIVPIVILWMYYKGYNSGKAGEKACACILPGVKFTEEDMRRLKIALQGKEEDVIPKPVAEYSTSSQNIKIGKDGLRIGTFPLEIVTICKNVPVPPLRKAKLEDNK